MSGTDYDVGVPLAGLRVVVAVNRLEGSFAGLGRIVRSEMMRRAQGYAHRLLFSLTLRMAPAVEVVSSMLRLGSLCAPDGGCLQEPFGS